MSMHAVFGAPGPLQLVPLSALSATHLQPPAPQQPTGAGGKADKKHKVCNTPCVLGPRTLSAEYWIHMPAHTRPSALQYLPVYGRRRTMSAE